MGSGDELRIYIMELAEALQQNIPAPPIPPDLPAGARSEIDLLLAGLGLAGNAGDPADMAADESGFAQRGLQTTDAMAKFPANEDQSVQAIEQVLNTAQQIPQSASGIGQGFSSAFGGVFQALNQAMQQGVQATTQLAGGLGKGGQGAELASEVPADALGDTLGAGEAALGAGGAAGGAAAGAAEGTGPTGYLGPPPIPSATTYPASAPSPPMPTPAVTDPAAESRAPVGGYPMAPPAAVGSSGGTGADAKTETKRVVVPSVKNGAPVQGRITVPQPPPEVVKRIDGKPVASRRIFATDTDPDDSADSGR
jgi:hypothetical protein